MQENRIFGYVLLAVFSALAPACVVHVGGGSSVYARGGDKAERQESFPLELAAGEELRVELPYGDIAVRVSEAEAPRVDAHWRAGGDDEAMAKEVLARFELDRSRGPGSLSITQKGEPLEVKGTFTHKSYAASVDLSLVVPPGVKLVASSTAGDLKVEGALATCRLNSSYGDVSARGVRGDTALATSSGSVKAADIEAEKLEASSGYGDIAAESVRATKVWLSTRSGNVDAREVQGELSIESSYGDLKIDGADGDLDAVTSSGDISLGAHGKAKRKLTTSYGDIRVRGAPGELAAKTSSGKVEVDDFDGNLRAVSSYGDVKVGGRLSALTAETSSGEITVHAAPGSTVDALWQVKSSYGDVTLRLPRADFSCKLEASARSGEVRCDGVDAPSGKPLRKLGHVFGEGGGSVEVESTSGDVRIALD